MSTIKSFEDLQVWQKARLLSRKIYQITTVFPTGEKNNLISQLRIYLAFDQSYITKVELTQLFDMIDDAGKMSSSFINKTRNYRLNKPSSKL